jgi:hypothetical protein
VVEDLPRMIDTSGGRYTAAPSIHAPLPPLSQPTLAPQGLCRGVGSIPLSTSINPVSVPSAVYIIPPAAPNRTDEPSES